jgi:hypothetical protein
LITSVTFVLVRVVEDKTPCEKLGTTGTATTGAAVANKSKIAYRTSKKTRII